MDISKALQALLAERARVQHMITALEAYQKTGASSIPHRRGRKSMDAAERKVVGERIRKYWQQRRAQAAAHPPAETDVEPH